MYIQRTRRYPAILAAILAFTLGNGSAGLAQNRQDPLARLSLDELLSEVQTANPGLRSAQWGWVSKLKKADEPSLPDPAVTFTYLPEPIYTARGAQTWQLRAEQRIPFPGKFRLQRETAVEEAYIAQQHAARLEFELAFQLKRAFFGLERIAAQERLTRDFAYRIEEFEQAASSRYKVGAGTQQAIVKAQLEGNRLDNVLLGLDRERIQMETLIARLRGDGNVSRIAPAQTELWEIPDGLDVDHLVGLALHQRPDIRAIDASMRQAKHVEDLSRKQLWPDFGIGVTYFGINRADIPASADGKDALALTASVQIPLFRSGRNAVTESAQIRQSSIELSRESAEINLRTEITEILWRMRLEHERLDLIRHTLIPQAQSTFDLALSGYTNGQVQFIDLLDAERGLFSIRNDLEASIESFKVALAELELALGIRSIAELESQGLLTAQTGANNE